MRMLLIIICCCLILGCDIPSDRIILEGRLSRRLEIKLDGMIGINSQIGSVIGYNTQKFNGPAFREERFYQFNLPRIPGNGFDHQYDKMIRSKIKGRYNIGGFIDGR
jgi:hypothetical protein